MRAHSFAEVRSANPLRMILADLSSLHGATRNISATASKRRDWSRSVRFGHSPRRPSPVTHDASRRVRSRPTRRRRRRHRRRRVPRRRSRARPALAPLARRHGVFGVRDERGRARARARAPRALLRPSRLRRARSPRRGGRGRRGRARARQGGGAHRVAALFEGDPVPVRRVPVLQQGEGDAGLPRRAVRRGGGEPADEERDGVLEGVQEGAGAGGGRDADQQQRRDHALAGRSRAVGDESEKEKERRRGGEGKTVDVLGGRPVRAS